VTSRKWQGSNWIRKSTRLRIYARDGFRCVYCDSRKRLTLDHIKPHVRGGSNAPTNLLTACLSCNSRRQHQPVARFVGSPEEGRRVCRQAKRVLPTLARIVVPRHLRDRFLDLVEGG